MRYRLQAGNIFSRLNVLSRRCGDFSPYFRAQGVKAISESVEKEFREEAWHSPSGVSVPWKESHGFGTRKAPLKTLHGTGKLFRAATLKENSIIRITARTLTVGIDDAAVPYASYIRGGSGGRINLSPLIIKPRKRSAYKGGADGQREWSMFWFLGLHYGVFLKKETLENGLVLYPRPFLTFSPALKLAMANGMKVYALGVEWKRTIG